MPNQDLLINLLPLLEARDSSAIENILTTTVGRCRPPQPSRYAALSRTRPWTFAGCREPSLAIRPQAR
ncbi:MAG: Fic/DOC family N-terminal domain-containing protein [Pseudomonadales bacterium]